MKTILLLLLVSLPLFSNSITVVHPDSYKPYSYVDSNGTSQGILIEWWKLWSNHSETAVAFIPCQTMSDAIDSVTTGSADVIAGLFYTEERNQKISYDDPIFRAMVSLFVRKSDTASSIINFSDTITVVSGDFAESLIAEQYPYIPLKVISSYDELLKQVDQDIPNAFFMDVPSLSTKNGKSALKFKGYKKIDVIKEEKFRPAVKKGNRELRRIIRDGADKIPAHELRDLAIRWNLLTQSRVPVLITISLLLLVTVLLLIVALLRIKKEKKRIVDIENRDWSVIISKGETDTIEFKSSLRYDFRQQCTNKKLELVIAKTISAFLNSEGGILFIGVDDDGNILGLENDYNSLQKKNSDGFILALTNTININLGKKCHHFISMHIISINDREVCIISVEKSDTPVFFGKGDKEEFYIRASASSQPLGLRETHEYISTHWAKR